MKAKHGKVRRLIDQIDALVQEALRFEKAFGAELSAVHPSFRQSATNLVHYRAIRRNDIRDLQNQLGSLGLSRLARAQSHVLASLLNTKSILEAMIRRKPVDFRASPVSIKRAEKLLRSHTKALFGNRSKGRRVRIMVTLPTEAAHDYQYVHDLVEAGMNSARINCAHDDRTTWAAMIQHVRLASEQQRRKVKICMDLGGPKIRTGPIKPGPRVVSYSPHRDSLGQVVAPGVIWLAEHDAEMPDNADLYIPVSKTWLQNLEVDDVIHFVDTRAKRRSLKVVQKTENGCLAHAYDRAFLVTGTLLRRNDQDADGEPVGDLQPLQERILLKTGDHLVLHCEPIEGESAAVDEEGTVLRTAHLSCTSTEIFQDVAINDRVRFDDGKIEGFIKAMVPGEQLEIEITYAKAGGQRLAADKGINFPDSNLKLKGLTAKDLEDLEFVVEHADVVNMSFVNTPDDVQDLIDALDQLGARDKIGVVLKIETQSGFNNLTEILLRGMQVHPVGVMIARGDLAVETGWENMPRIQEEILAYCQAAHVPDVWATQVLENLAKKGLPSRAEVTDAASSLQAECVMLNKGVHIHRAVRVLDAILKNMKGHRHDKAPMLPPIVTASG